MKDFDSYSFRKAKNDCTTGLVLAFTGLLLLLLLLFALLLLLLVSLKAEIGIELAELVELGLKKRRLEGVFDR